MLLNRRQTIKALGAGLLAGLTEPLLRGAETASAQRHFHICLPPDAIERDPDLLSVVNRAGIGHVWLAGYFYGHWPYKLERLVQARSQVERLGMTAHLVNIPLGHPGDSLGAMDGSFPLTPPAHWKLGCRPDGRSFAGTSLHEPATAENVEALRQLYQAGFRSFFLDDDFRLARSPGEIGGCFCTEHQRRFLQQYGYGAKQWPELLAQVTERSLSPMVRHWVEFTADELSGCFRAQRRAVPEGELGIMAMYLGAEKAGIRLQDYRDVPFRVGELMFDDHSFGTVKGKMDELFSALMHRRFCRPERAFSETTAYPAHQLSARNLAAKLAISTIADVRNTMFMSGLTPFPKSHWEVLEPAMKAQAKLHQRLAGHPLQGPLKHYWGEASRLVGDDKPFSLFLAAGIPFEVTDQPATEGWTFLSDADAQAKNQGPPTGTNFIYRDSCSRPMAPGESMKESLESLFSFKAKVAAQLTQVPYVEENEATVCAWFPTAKSVLLWNPQEQARKLTLRLGQQRREVALDALEAKLIENVF